MYEPIYLVHSFLPKVRGGGGGGGGEILIFKIWTNSWVMKYYSEIGGLVKGKGGGSKLFHQIFFGKAFFQYYWNTSFFCLVNIHAYCNQ